MGIVAAIAPSLVGLGGTCGTLHKSAEVTSAQRVAGVLLSLKFQSATA